MPGLRCMMPGKRSFCTPFCSGGQADGLRRALLALQGPCRTWSRRRLRPFPPCNRASCATVTGRDRISPVLAGCQRSALPPLYCGRASTSVASVLLVSRQFVQQRLALDNALFLAARLQAQIVHIRALRRRECPASGYACPASGAQTWRLPPARPPRSSVTGFAVALRPGSCPMFWHCPARSA